MIMKEERILAKEVMQVLPVFKEYMRVKSTNDDTNANTIILDALKDSISKIVGTTKMAAILEIANKMSYIEDTEDFKEEFCKLSLENPILIATDAERRVLFASSIVETLIAQNDDQFGFMVADDSKTNKIVVTHKVGVKRTEMMKVLDMDIKNAKAVWDTDKMMFLMNFIYKKLTKHFSLNFSNMEKVYGVKVTLEKPVLEKGIVDGDQKQSRFINMNLVIKIPYDKEFDEDIFEVIPSVGNEMDAYLKSLLFD